MPPPDATGFQPFGDGALLVELDGAAEAQVLAASLRRRGFPGLLGVVPGLSSMLVEFDPLLVDEATVEREVTGRMGVRGTFTEPRGRLRTIPVVYGGESGPDLPEVARLTGRSPQEVIAAHSTAELRVLFDGFAPGFAYLGDLPPELHVPRLATPRTRTPRGSVAIAGPMGGIYPADLPGGWRVIGRTPLTLFDALRDPPAYLVPGDSVRFQPMDEAEWDAHVGQAEDW